jgi:transcriptional regulator with XRE-family HTH domain
MPVPARKRLALFKLKRSLVLAMESKMKADKLSVSALANRIGTNRTAVRRVLDRKNTSISLVTMFRAADALGLNISLSVKKKTPTELGRIATRLVDAPTESDAEAITEELVAGFFGKTLHAETSTV